MNKMDNTAKNMDNVLDIIETLLDALKQREIFFKLAA